MAADRAAELTEAYRILSDETRRAEYDGAVAAGASVPTVTTGASRAEPARPQGDAPAAPPSASAPGPAGAAPQTGAQFTQERATRDEFVRKATIGRIRQALDAVGGRYDQSSARGFDFACTPKSKLFGRGKGPRLLGRFVSRVDGQAIAEVWSQAGKLGAPTNEEVCVFLFGPAIAAPRELADAITANRRKAQRGAKVTIIPIDVRNWDAHMPVDAPPIAKDLLARLRSGT